MTRRREWAVAYLLFSILLAAGILGYGLYKAALCSDKGGVFVQWRCVKEVE